jgi:hypothetical protein
MFLVVLPAFGARCCKLHALAQVGYPRFTRSRYKVRSRDQGLAPSTHLWADTQRHGAETRASEFRQGQSLIRVRMSERAKYSNISASRNQFDTPFNFL